MSKKTIEIEITTDHNDGDYLTETTAITPEQLEKIKPIIEAISNHKGSYNFGRGDVFEGDILEMYPQFTEEELENFLYMCPSDCNAGFHTLESVNIYPVPVRERLL